MKPDGSYWHARGTRWRRLAFVSSLAFAVVAFLPVLLPLPELPSPSTPAEFCEAAYACEWLCPVAAAREAMCARQGCRLASAECVYAGLPVCMMMGARTVVCEYDARLSA